MSIPTWNRDKEAGEEFQDYVRLLLWHDGIAVDFYQSRKHQLRAGEGPSGIECKLDKRRRDTGNYYVEIAAFLLKDGSRRWCLSGIYRDIDIHTLAIGDEREFMLVSKRQLQQLFVRGDFQTATTYIDTPTAGFLVPHKRMLQVAWKWYLDGIPTQLDQFGRGGEIVFPDKDGVEQRLQLHFPERVFAMAAEF